MNLEGTSSTHNSKENLWKSFVCCGVHPWTLIRHLLCVSFQKQSEVRAPRWHTREPKLELRSNPEGAARVWIGTHGLWVSGPHKYIQSYSLMAVEAFIPAPGNGLKMKGFIEFISLGYSSKQIRSYRSCWNGQKNSQVLFLAGSRSAEFTS